jgi:hypothetical protein
VSRKKKTPERRIAALGWKDGTVTEFLNLPPEESALIEITVQPVGVVAEQRRERIKLDQAVAYEITESREYDLLAE